jgi:GTP diphosphokinase / guanosine-3',5'-bis(diphosphate) 3'-diphosphatase
MTVSSENNIEKAKKTAAQIHKGHKRATGEDFHEHTIRVYEKLKNVGIRDEVTLVASILHQALDVSAEIEKEIEDKFGLEVVKLIKNYTKLRGANIERNTPRNFNERYIMQTYINMADDVRTLVIRLADKIDNLETSFVLPKEKRLSNAEKALYFYSPLARIIGMGKLAVQLEDSAFKILHPGEYAHLRKKLSKRTEHINKAVEDVEKMTRSLLKEKSINPKIYHRMKHLYGIYRKASYYKSKGKKVGKNYENIFDIAGMRVIVDTVENCYLVENLLSELLDYIPEARDDYIRHPRETGYKSLHNTFKIANDLYIEIQIRTQEMHELCEFGPASHLLYKIGDKDSKSSAVEKFKDYLKENPYWFKDLNFWEIEKALVEYNPQTPFSKYVYAFTPKGDIIELPKGATIIDFAYAVHSKLGDSCIGGFVNSQMVKLNHEIKDGDIVEIKTQKSKTKPSSDWLKLVKTSRAKTHIRKALKM